MNTTALILLEPPGPKAGTPVQGAPAQDAGPAPASPPGGGLMMFLPFLILIPFLFMAFRRQKREQEQRGSLKKGDRVVAGGGLIGELMELDEKTAKVKIAPGVNVQVTISSISPVPVDAKAASADKALKDLKDAKAAAEKK